MNLARFCPVEASEGERRAGNEAPRGKGSVVSESLASISHRVVDARGLAMHIAEAGEGPLVLLLHGFPECWYSWRHQLLALADAGYHAVAPDQRGYGRTGEPPKPGIESYSMLHLVGDVIGVIDALGADQA